MNDLSRLAGRAPFVPDTAAPAGPDYANYRVVPARYPARTAGTVACASFRHLHVRQLRERAFELALPDETPRADRV